MATAKDLIIKPIDRNTANALVRKEHYSGKVVNNSQLHFGVYWQGKLEGCLQFGPSLDKRKIQGLVAGTQWHQFIELNRMAFSEALPRNSESRAIAICMKLIRKHAPQIKWVISFADATQCGDGTIYRASGFVLTSIKANDQIWIAPQGAVTLSRGNATKGKHITHSASLRPGIGAITTAARTGGGSSMKAYQAAGFRPLEGFQLRYIYFIDQSWKSRLTVPIVPFSEIDKMQAGMYKGTKRVVSADSGTSGDQPEGDGASPITTLHNTNDS